jgi:hypothetical protein
VLGLGLVVVGFKAIITRPCHWGFTFVNNTQRNWIQIHLRRNFFAYLSSPDTPAGIAARYDGRVASPTTVSMSERACGLWTVVVRPGALAAEQARQREKSPSIHPSLRRNAFDALFLGSLFSFLFPCLLGLGAPCFSFHRRF